MNAIAIISMWHSSVIAKNKLHVEACQFLKNLIGLSVGNFDVTRTCWVEACWADIFLLIIFPGKLRKFFICRG